MTKVVKTKTAGSPWKKIEMLNISWMTRIYLITCLGLSDNQLFYRMPGQHILSPIQPPNLYQAIRFYEFTGKRVGIEFKDRSDLHGRLF